MKRRSDEEISAPLYEYDAAIRAQYLQPCYDALQAGDLAGCKTKYVRMVRDLEREYLS